MTHSITDEQKEYNQKLREIAEKYRHLIIDFEHLEAIADELDRDLYPS